MAMIFMCSLEVYCYNKNRDGKEFYEELVSQVDENHHIKEEKWRNLNRVIIKMGYDLFTGGNYYG